LFLVVRDRYSSLFKLKRKDYKGWARGLKAAGYANDPKYAEKLISLIERFNLTRFDE
jgi:flagellum-specific peptidoglycan hydrolase FlgJ